MFRFQTSGQAKNDKLGEAILFAREVAEYINNKYPVASVQVYSEVFEDFNNVYWYSDYEDLATIERFRSQLRSDQGYWAIVFKGMEYFTEKSFRDTLMSSV
jgi:hypothetical protein